MQAKRVVREIVRAAALVLAVLSLSVPGEAAAQVGGELVGRVLTQDGAAVTDADVRILDLGRQVRTDEDGAFRFADVPVGEHLLEAASARAGRAVERVTVEAGATLEITLVVQPVFHGEEIVVTAGLQAQRRSDLFQAVSVLGGAELRDRARASLGETLDGEPGISSTYFGPGASRPVIRGLGSDRVRVLEGGIGVGDASSTSPDHAVSVEAGSAERIEIIRGPATLLYGSSAIGGVVNVVDRRIPTELTTRPVTGSLTLLGGTVADERNGSVQLDGSVGRLAWHLSGLRRHTDDYNIPRAAEGPDGEEPELDGQAGVLENSALETTRGAAGLSWVGRDGYVGASFSGLDSEYGIPGHGHDDEEGEAGEAEEEEVAIDLQQRRFDAEAAWRPEGRFIQRLKVRVGATNYRHFELEGEEIGTRFENDRWEARLEAQHRLGDATSGAFGVQVSQRDFSAIGEEAFVPPTDTESWGVFLFEELGSGALRYQLGARYERQTVKNPTEGLEVDQDGVSLSGGANWRASERVSLALAATRSVKLPSAEELFSDGPHLATNAFEVGDAGLDREVGHSVDATLRLREGPVTGDVTLFLNSFDRFIFQTFTDEEEDGLPVLLYTQGDARFVGVEGSAQVELLHRAGHHLALELLGDYVRAELTEADEPLPRIPPVRLGSGLRYQGDGWTGRVGLRRVTAQDRVAPFEEPTDGYTMLDASVGYRLFSGGVGHQITLSATNLTNELARNHVSFLKEQAPLPGREVRLSYRLFF